MIEAHLLQTNIAMDIVTLIRRKRTLINDEL